MTLIPGLRAFVNANFQPNGVNQINAGMLRDVLLDILNNIELRTGSFAVSATTYADAVTQCANLPAATGAIVKVAADESTGNAGLGASGANPTTYYLYFPGVGLQQLDTVKTVSSFAQAQAKAVAGRPATFIITNDSEYGGSPSEVIWNGSTFWVSPLIQRTT